MSKLVENDIVELLIRWNGDENSFYVYKVDGKPGSPKKITEIGNRCVAWFSETDYTVINLNNLLYWNVKLGTILDETTDWSINK